MSVSLYLYVTTFFYAFLYKNFGFFFFSPHSFLCFCLLSRFVNDDIAFAKLLLFLYVSLLVILFVSMFFHFVAFVSLLSFSKHLFMLLCCCIYFRVTLFECCLHIANVCFSFDFPLVFMLLCASSCVVFLVFFITFCFSFVVQDYSSLVSSSFFTLHSLHTFFLLQFFYLCCTSFFAHFNFATILHLYCCPCTIFLKHIGLSHLSFFGFTYFFLFSYCVGCFIYVLSYVVCFFVCMSWCCFLFSL